jgi:serine/threonine protein phosphatase PrpC
MIIQSFSLQGKRESNEDQHIGIININNVDKTINPVNLIGVFDGHGGKLVSKFLKLNLPKYIYKKNSINIFDQNNTIITNYFHKLFDKLQNNLIKEHPIAAKRCGSTALVGVMHKTTKGYKNTNYIWIANVGDSRAVLYNHLGKAIQLSQDHKPHHTPEKKRIENIGGKIKFDGVDWRIGDLSLSRAIGDLDNTPYVTHNPEIFKYKINKKDKFIIFACDGLWDVVNNNEAVNYINFLIEKKYTGNIAKKLAEYAITKGSYDNVTISILFI